MCVICVKPKGVQMPSREILRAMYQANSHGCGFCTPTLYFRGLSFDSFMQKIRKVSIDEPCIMHFRLATHGSVKRSNCHPFYDADSDTYFAHNGILNIHPAGDKTDSETAFRDIFVPYIKAYGFDSDDTRYAIRQVRANTGSKFAFLQGGELHLYGDFQRFADCPGCFFSNLRFTYYIYEMRIFRHNMDV